MHTVDTTTEMIVKRIDAILSELQDLRRAVLEQSRLPEENLTEQLYGSMGQGTWEEYDQDLDWKRFES